MGVFVSRDGENHITGRFACAQVEGQEYLADDAPELVALLAAEAKAAARPRPVTNFQGRTVLRLHDLFDPVQAAITAIEDVMQRTIAQDAFERGAFEVESPLLNQVLTQLGHDEAFRDALFVEAAAISV